MSAKTTIITALAVIAVVVIAVWAFVAINKDNKEGPAIAADMSGNASGSNDNSGTSSQSFVPHIDGVDITVLKEGTGSSAQAGDTVSVNYTGRLSDGTVFDSNTDPKFSHVEPFTFTLGDGQVIRGWDEGVVGMKVGEERKLVISPNYAYGSGGIKGIIPPNSTLTFDVTMLSVNSGSSAKSSQ